MLLGEYHAKMDQDGRIALPDAWAQYAEGCALRARFSFERTAVECISVQDEALRRAEFECAEVLDATGGEVGLFKESDPIEIPVESGTLVISTSMAEELGIVRDVILVGVGHGFWIWNPIAWNSQLEDAEIMRSGGFV